MHKGLQKRNHPRHRSSCQVRVYTSVSKMGYHVELRDISRSGALLITRHVPGIGETINIEILDDRGRRLFQLSALVKNHRSITGGYGTDSGCGIQFLPELTLDQLARVSGS